LQPLTSPAANVGFDFMDMTQPLTNAATGTQLGYIVATTKYLNANSGSNFLVPGRRLGAALG